MCGTEYPETYHALETLVFSTLLYVFLLMALAVAWWSHDILWPPGGAQQPDGQVHGVCAR
jgi:hypothetical protein